MRNGREDMRGRMSDRRGGDRRGYDRNYMGRRFEPRMGERNYGRGDSQYSERRGSMGRRGYERNREYGDYREDDNNNDKRDMRYDNHYYDPREFEYNGYGYDYAEKPMELKPSDLKAWEKELKNVDGTYGAKFSKEQISPIARQHGIEFDENKFTEEEFALVTNIMYSDYSKALQKSALASYNKPEPYVLLAEAWLCDEDFDGEPYEKLALYYYGVADYQS